VTHRYTDEQIAQVVHAANRALQYIQGDESPSQPWQVESQEIRDSSAAGVREARKGATPEQLHEAWLVHRFFHGWTYGPVKDPDAKTHPCLVPYSELPESQQDKDRLFLAIVRVLSEGK
jgi:hypothetical protein